MVRMCVQWCRTGESILDCRELALFFFFYEDAVSQSLPDTFQLLLSPRPADVYFSLWGRKTKRG